MFTVPDSNKYNDGTAGTVTEWPWETFRLPFVNTGKRLKLTGEVDIEHGALNVDNIHLFTRQK